MSREFLESDVSLARIPQLITDVLPQSYENDTELITISGPALPAPAWMIESLHKAWLRRTNEESN